MRPWIRLTILLVLVGCCSARNFKYISDLTVDQYAVYKSGITDGSLGTLFPVHPAQIFSCHFDIAYSRFHHFGDGGDDVFQYTAKATPDNDYYRFVSDHMFSTWSSCYQNFVTRYCMSMPSVDEDEVASRFKIRQCKHMYFPKTPENRRLVKYLVREVKPYINFHMLEHMQNKYPSTWNTLGLYPPGIEYLVHWPGAGYRHTPSQSYRSMRGIVVKETVHGVEKFPYANFTILSDSSRMQLFQITHEILWTFVANYRGVLSHELINAYQDLDHIQLHYLTHKCVSMLDPVAASSVRTPDILHPDMCPNPCHEKSVCSTRSNTMGGECTATGVGKHDFECNCLSGYKWNKASLSCDESLDCDKKCRSSNTRNCYFVPSVSRQPADVGPDGVTGREGHVVCVCYPEFEGESCERRRDACRTGAEGRKSGAEQCRTDLGGNCTATVGTSHYLCSCPSQFRTLKSIPEDNCLLRNTSCHSVICANNGACHSSPDGVNYKCECTPGFEGELCELPIAHHWTHWGDWSPCDSLCGQGWQMSKRTCWDRGLGRPSSRARCSGNADMLRICHKHCLTEIQASHYIAIDLHLELLFRMLIVIVGCFLFVKITFDLLFRESDYVFVRYLRTVVLDLVRRAVGESLA